MPEFRDRTAVAERLHNNPMQTAALIESVLTVDQVATLESELFPAATPEQRREAIEGAQRLLIRAGVSPDDPAVASLRAELTGPPARPE